jgi:hypothetical protein
LGVHEERPGASGFTNGGFRRDYLLSKPQLLRPERLRARLQQQQRLKDFLLKVQAG